MRRREAMALRLHEEQQLEADRAAAILRATTVLPVEERMNPGTCPKCRQHIGRGLRGHVVACQGSPTLAMIDAVVAALSPVPVEPGPPIESADGLKVCPKCGKGVKPRGIHSHVRNCKAEDPK